MARKGDTPDRPLYVDGPTGSTLSEIKTLLQQIEDNTDGLEGKDFATEVTLEAARVLLSALSGKLPTAAALGDADANPTTTRIGSHLMAWDSAASQWARAQGRSTGDGQGNVFALLAQARAMNFNGSTFDRQRGVGALDGATAASLPRKHGATVGIPVAVMMGRDPAAGAEAYVVPNVRSPGDNLGTTPDALHVMSAGLLYNGAAFDRERSNIEATALSSAARTASTNSSDMTNHNQTGLTAFLDITGLGVGSTLQLLVQGKDPVTGNYVTLANGSAQATTGTTFVHIYPGASAGLSDGFASAPLPRTWRIRVVHGNGLSCTYSVGVCIID